MCSKLKQTRAQLNALYYSLFSGELREKCVCWCDNTKLIYVTLNIITTYNMKIWMERWYTMKLRLREYIVHHKCSSIFLFRHEQVLYSCSIFPCGKIYIWIYLKFFFTQQWKVFHTLCHACIYLRTRRNKTFALHLHFHFYTISSFLIYVDEEEDAIEILKHTQMHFTKHLPKRSDIIEEKYRQYNQSGVLQYTSYILQC